MKKQKNNLISVLALVCALAALILSVISLAAVPEDQSHLISDLYTENAKLRDRVDALEEKMEQLMTAVNLQSWTLDVEPWADSTGAEVTLTAIPSSYQNGVSATLIVMLDGKQVVQEACVWNGSAFAATVSLDAADGYSYDCILSSPNGSQKLPLTGPNTADAGIPVYLSSSLSAYCNLVVNDWVENSGVNLVLTNAYAQAQLPRISADGAVEIAASELVLRLNGGESVRIPIALMPSEVEGSFELTIMNLQIPMPELENADLLELYLDIALTDGRHLSAFGINWHLEDGKLVSTVG
jgi:hypothetical protein